MAELTKTTAKSAARKFTVAKLRENCRELFGISTSTFDGAAYELTDKYTVEEMKARIKAWEKKEIK